MRTSAVTRLRCPSSFLDIRCCLPKFRSLVILWITLILALMVMFSGLPTQHRVPMKPSLPAQLGNEPGPVRLCCRARTCSRALTSFSERKGQPPYVEAYDKAGEGGQLLGYVILSTDIIDIPAYSGKPVVTLIGMDTTGHFVGVKVLKHSEPILLLGIPEAALTKFIDQYVGKFVGDKIEIGQSRPDEGVIGLDAITGATVTVIAQNQVMMRCGHRVARQVGILAPTVRAQARYTVDGRALDWDELVEEGAVQRLMVQPEEVGPGSAAPSPSSNCGLATSTSPTSGAACSATRLGKPDVAAQARRARHFRHRTAAWNRSRARASCAAASTTGCRSRRTWTPSPSATSTTSTCTASRPPARRALHESAIFIIRSKAFSARPTRGTWCSWPTAWTAPTGAKDLHQLRPRILAARPLSRRRPAGDRRAGRDLGAGLEVTRGRDRAVRRCCWSPSGVVYALRDKLVRRSTHKNKWPVKASKYTAWAISHRLRRLLPAGAALHHAGADLVPRAAVQVDLGTVPVRPVHLPVLDLHHHHRVLLGARAVLRLDVPVRLAVRADLQGGARDRVSSASSATLPQRWHDRLKWLKYVIFFGLLAVSFFSMGLAEKLSEVEPFKTTFLVGVVEPHLALRACSGRDPGLVDLHRAPFCKYLCPLGAALAMPIHLPLVGPQAQAGMQHLQGVRRGLRLAGHRRRRPHRPARMPAVPGLHGAVHRRPRPARRWPRSASAASKAGLPLTPIGATAISSPSIRPAAAPSRQRQAAMSLIRACPPTRRCHRTRRGARGLRWLWLELRDHLWPWSSEAGIRSGRCRWPASPWP